MRLGRRACSATPGQPLRIERQQRQSEKEPGQHDDNAEKEDPGGLDQQTQLTVAAKGIEAFAAIPGKELITLTDDEAAAFRALNAPVVAKIIEETGGNAKAVIEALAASK